MRPKSLYHALGMDKKVYSDAPTVKRAPVIQNEYYYVYIDGRTQQDAMLNILNMPSVRCDSGVKSTVRSQKSSIVRVNIEERLNNSTKMKVIMSNRGTVKADASETITLSQFLGEIT